MFHVGKREFEERDRIILQQYFPRELRPIGKTLNINAHTPSVDSIRELSINCTGTKVTILTFQVLGKRTFIFH